MPEGLETHPQTTLVAQRSLELEELKRGCRRELTSPNGRKARFTSSMVPGWLRQSLMSWMPVPRIADRHASSASLPGIVCHIASVKYEVPDGYIQTMETGLEYEFAVTSGWKNSKDDVKSLLEYMPRVERHFIGRQGANIPQFEENHTCKFDGAWMAKQKYHMIALGTRIVDKHASSASLGAMPHLSIQFSWKSVREDGERPLKYMTRVERHFIGHQGADIAQCEEDHARKFNGAWVSKQMHHIMVLGAKDRR
ncbi:hypothetical protein EDB85DRAFT_1892035 [Lactarius pseudohatsudake]|nr:hypothetical protein EDB85DRAFT_1892035 [Lactarius pseudohatsudake]